jgi:membrane-associated protease RseP (regulator of RpoE activity)
VLKCCEAVATFLPSLLAALFGLPLLLAGMHWVLWRWLGHPAPLHQRERAVPGRARAASAALGVVLAYFTCVLLYFAAFSLEPSASSLALDPVRGGPAHQAGVRPGDRARALDGRRLQSFEQLTDALKRSGARVELELERDGQIHRVVVAKSPEGKIGVRSQLTTIPSGQAAGQALVAPARTVALYLRGWIDAVVGSSAVGFAGPVALMRHSATSFLSALALLLSSSLPRVVIPYLALLAIDAYARRRYQALGRAKSPAASPGPPPPR